MQHTNSRETFKEHLNAFKNTTKKLNESTLNEEIDTDSDEYQEFEGEAGSALEDALVAATKKWIKRLPKLAKAAGVAETNAQTLASALDDYYSDGGYWEEMFEMVTGELR